MHLLKRNTPVVNKPLLIMKCLKRIVMGRQTPN